MKFSRMELSRLALGVFCGVLLIGIGQAHQGPYGHPGVQALGGHKSSPHYFRWKPHQITIPKPTFSVRRVPLPLPYPVFKHHAIPMYSPKEGHQMRQQHKAMKPMKIPKYVPVPIHKVIEIPQFIEVPVEVPVYQEVIVRRPVEVPVPVYITRKAVPTASHSQLVAALPTGGAADSGGVHVGGSPVALKGSASALIPVMHHALW